MEQDPIPINTPMPSKRSTAENGHGHAYSLKRHCNLEVNVTNKDEIHFESDHSLEHNDGKFDVMNENFLPTDKEEETQSQSNPNHNPQEIHCNDDNANINNTNENDNDHRTHSQDDMDDDPDWDTIAQNEPASRDVPLFLAARDKRYTAEARFASALDEAHANLKLVCDEILTIAADVYNDRRDKLDAMEVQIKQDFVGNEAARSNMSKKLQDFAAQAQAQFQELMMRLANGNASR